MPYDVVIVGGGPAGLSAALVLGRGRKRVVLFDAGPARNAAATGIYGFVTRDGTPPAEFRALGREQLRAYPSIEVADARVDAVAPEGGLFQVRAGERALTARRVLLCVGMIDEPLDLPGYRELWGKSIFQCPYCHGWEVQDRAFGLLVASAPMLEHALLFTGWSRDLVVFTAGAFAVPDDVRVRLTRARVRIEERPIRSLQARDGHLEAIELGDGARVACDVLFARPRQSQVPLVRALDLALDEQGFVRVDEFTRRTSVPGIHAAGDLTTMAQGALVAAAAGAMAAYAMNAALTIEARDREAGEGAPGA